MIITASIDLLLSAGDVRRSYQVAELAPSDVMSSLSLEMVPFPPSQPAVNVDSSPDLGPRRRDLEGENVLCNFNRADFLLLVPSLLYYRHSLPRQQASKHGPCDVNQSV